jgi:hypothetical protein
VKLVVPYVGELLDLDARLVRLAELLGIPCETLRLAKVADPAEFLEKTMLDQGSCFVVNPHVIKEWVGGDRIPAALVTFLLTRFQHLVVHGLRVSAFDNKIVAALSRGRLKSVVPIDRKSSVYTIAKDTNDVCGAFSGLSFGPVRPANDHVFCTGSSDPALRTLISIGAEPFMAAVRLEGAEVLFLASENVADLNAEAGETLPQYFSQFMPHAMALRYAAGDECWRPSRGHASIIIDDPLLRKSYGFINFESLLRLAVQQNFHAAIAFIPHNFRRNSSQITKMFRENATRLSISFHGNDHTEAEFASTDPNLLNNLLRVAEERMNLHYQRTGLPCDRVMVFPQGNFSIEAMKVLKCHNFYAAVNTVPHPAEQPVRLTIGELAQPAVLRYGGFPLFLRKPIRYIQSHDIAFNIFFGRPILIVEHHEVFKDPDSLAEIAARINSVSPDVYWCNLATVAANSVLTRVAPDGTRHVRAYSSTIRVSNNADVINRYSIEWGGSGDGSSIERVLKNEMSCSGYEVDDAGVRVSVELPPSSSQTFSLGHRSDTIIRRLGLRWDVQAFLRRRLSEIRDNYLSKNQRLLTAAQDFQHRFLRL